MKAIDHFIKSVLTPAGCGENSTVLFFKKNFKSMSLKKGDFLISAGDTDYKLFFVDSGLIRIFIDTENGEQFTRTFIKEGQFSAETTYYWQQIPIPVSAQALEDCEILYCDYAEYDALSTTNIDFAKLMIAEFKRYKIRHQTRELLLQSLTVEEYYTRVKQDFPDIEMRIKQCHLASYLGVSEVTLSRIKKKLNNKKS